MSVLNTASPGFKVKCTTGLRPTQLIYRELHIFVLLLSVAAALPVVPLRETSEVVGKEHFAETINARFQLINTYARKYS